MRSKPECLLLIMAFDLIHLDNKDLRRLPVEERRQLLQDLIGPGDAPICFSEAFDGDAEAVFAAIDRLGLEGIVSKRKGTRYRIGVQREKGKPAMVLCSESAGN
jgi:ATP-dependent DNA ligase